MPRTIDSIAESHRIAGQRRAAGLPSWGRTINIKAILHEDPQNVSDDHAAEVANRIGALIRRQVPGWVDWKSNDLDEQLTEIVEGLEALRPDSYENDDDFSPLEDLNNMLDQLYDWANRKRVWLGH